MSFFYDLDKTLTNCDSYFIELLNKEIIIHTNNNDSIYISQDSISLNGIFSISKIENIDISITTDTNEEISIRNCEIISVPTTLLGEKKVLESNSVYSILFTIRWNKCTFSYKIFNPQTSVFCLKNLGEEESLSP